MTALPKGLTVAIMVAGLSAIGAASVSDNFSDSFNKATKIVSVLLLLLEAGLFIYAVYFYYPVVTTSSSQPVAHKAETLSLSPDDEKRIDTLSQQLNAEQKHTEQENEQGTVPTGTIGLKSEALDIAQELLIALSKIKTLAGQHGAIDPNALPNPSPQQYDGFLAQWEQERRDHEQAQELAVKLVNDYNTIYAPRVIKLRRLYINYGQTDEWQPENYYAHVDNIKQVENILGELPNHAKLLK